MTEAELKEYTREQLEDLLLPMLSRGLDVTKKRNQVKNLLTEMRSRDQTVVSQQKGNKYFWMLADSGSP